MRPTDVCSSFIACAGLSGADMDLAVVRATICASPRVLASLRQLARGVLPRLTAAADAFKTLAPPRM